MIHSPPNLIVTKIDYLNETTNFRVFFSVFNFIDIERTVLKKIRVQTFSTSVKTIIINSTKIGTN